MNASDFLIALPFTKGNAVISPRHLHLPALNNVPCCARSLITTNLNDFISNEIPLSIDQLKLLVSSIRNSSISCCMSRRFLRSRALGRVARHKSLVLGCT
jgi:hypothetical protein